MPFQTIATLQTTRTVTRAVASAILLLTCGLTSAADIDDPTRGDVALFPAPLEELKTTTSDNPRPPLGWNIPGHNFSPSEGWWGLVCGKVAECRLIGMRLEITPATHPVFETDAVPSQWLVWSPLPSDGELLAVFKPIRSLASMPLATGQVKTWLHRAMKGAYPDGGRIANMEVAIPIAPGNDALLVPRLRLAATDSNGHSIAESLVLELRQAKRSQVLDDFDNSDGDGEILSPVTPKDYLVWAGDLDSDGKLDLMLKLGNCSRKVVLLLSSQAKGQDLVGPGGSFQYFDPAVLEC